MWHDKPSDFNTFTARFIRINVTDKWLICICCAIHSKNVVKNPLFDNIVGTSTREGYLLMIVLIINSLDTVQWAKCKRFHYLSQLRILSACIMFASWRTKFIFFLWHFQALSAWMLCRTWFKSNSTVRRNIDFIHLCMGWIRRELKFWSLTCEPA